MAEPQGDLITTAGPCPTCSFPGGLHRCPGRRAESSDAGVVALARDLARHVPRPPDRRGTADIQEATPHVSVGWRPVEVDYARRLIGSQHVTGFDPHCTRCGHRALDHGLDALPPEDRWRWFNAEAVACRWRGCGCTEWSPARGVRSTVEAVGEALVGEAWVELPLGPDWIIAYRLVNDRGKPVVGELRVFPAEPGRPGPGRWSGEVLGTLATVPAGGITHRRLRGLRVRAYLPGIKKLMRDLRDQHAEFAEALGWGAASPAAAEPRPPGAPGRRGRKGRPDAFYAKLAAQYARLVERAHPRPIKTIADRRGLQPTQVRDMIVQARKRGLLTGTGSVESGVAGGALTERAEALLQSHRPAGGRGDGTGKT